MEKIEKTNTQQFLNNTYLLTLSKKKWFKKHGSPSPPLKGHNQGDVTYSLTLTSRGAEGEARPDPQDNCTGLWSSASHDKLPWNPP